MRYTAEEVNLITQMLKDLATLKQKHPAGLNVFVDDATDAIVTIREFILGVIKEQERTL